MPTCGTTGGGSGVTIPLAPRAIALAIVLGVVALTGLYGILSLLALVLAFHIGFRLKTGRWMEMDGT